MSNCQHADTVTLPPFSRSQAEREEDGNGNKDQTVGDVTMTLPQLSCSQAEREESENGKKGQTVKMSSQLQ